MFIIHPVNNAKGDCAFGDAIDLLSTYDVQCTPLRIGPSLLITVEGVDEHLAEMAFQMNWHQIHGCCVVCANADDHKEGDTCGHLTFHKEINPAF